MGGWDSSSPRGDDTPTGLAGQGDGTTRTTRQRATELLPLGREGDNTTLKYDTRRTGATSIPATALEKASASPGAVAPTAAAVELTRTDGHGRAPQSSGTDDHSVSAIDPVAVEGTLVARQRKGSDGTLYVRLSPRFNAFGGDGSADGNGAAAAAAQQFVAEAEAGFAEWELRAAIAAQRREAERLNVSSFAEGPRYPAAAGRRHRARSAPRSPRSTHSGLPGGRQDLRAAARSRVLPRGVSPRGPLDTVTAPAPGRSDTALSWNEAVRSSDKPRPAMTQSLRAYYRPSTAEQRESGQFIPEDQDGGHSKPRGPRKPRSEMSLEERQKERAAKRAARDQVARRKRKGYGRGASDSSRKPPPEYTDNKFYTEPRIMARESVRFSEDVRTETIRIWNVIERCWGPKGLTKERFFVLYYEVLRILYRGDPPPDDQAREILEADWKRDSQGETFLDFDRFALSWFQIADQWTTVISERASAEFMCWLYGLLVVRNRWGADVFIWLRDDARFSGAPKRPSVPDELPARLPDEPVSGRSTAVASRKSSTGPTDSEAGVKVQSTAAHDTDQSSRRAAATRSLPPEVAPLEPFDMSRFASADSDSHRVAGDSGRRVGSIATAAPSARRHSRRDSAASRKSAVTQASDRDMNSQDGQQADGSVDREESARKAHIAVPQSPVMSSTVDDVFEVEAAAGGDSAAAPTDKTDAVDGESHGDSRRSPSPLPGQSDEVGSREDELPVQMVMKIKKQDATDPDRWDEFPADYSYGSGAGPQCGVEGYLAGRTGGPIRGSRRVGHWTSQPRETAGHLRVFGAGDAASHAQKRSAQGSRRDRKITGDGSVAYYETQDEADLPDALAGSRAHQFRRPVHDLHERVDDRLRVTSSAKETNAARSTEDVGTARAAGPSSVPPRVSTENRRDARTADRPPPHRRVSGSRINDARAPSEATISQQARLSYGIDSSPRPETAESYLKLSHGAGSPLVEQGGFPLGFTYGYEISPRIDRSTAGGTSVRTERAARVETAAAAIAGGFLVSGRPVTTPVSLLDPASMGTTANFLHEPMWHTEDKRVERAQIDGQPAVVRGTAKPLFVGDVGIIDPAQIVPTPDVPSRSSSTTSKLPNYGGGYNSGRHPRKSAASYRGRDRDSRSGFSPRPPSAPPGRRGYDGDSLPRFSSPPQSLSSASGQSTTGARRAARGQRGRPTTAPQHMIESGSRNPSHPSSGHSNPRSKHVARETKHSRELLPQERLKWFATALPSTRKADAETARREWLRKWDTPQSHEGAELGGGERKHPGLTGLGPYASETSAGLSEYDQTVSAEQLERDPWWRAWLTSAPQEPDLIDEPSWATSATKDSQSSVGQPHRIEADRRVLVVREAPASGGDDVGRARETVQREGSHRGIGNANRPLLASPTRSITSLTVEPSSGALRSPVRPQRNLASRRRAHTNRGVRAERESEAVEHAKRMANWFPKAANDAGIQVADDASSLAGARRRQARRKRSLAVGPATDDASQAASDATVRPQNDAWRTRGPTTQKTAALNASDALPGRGKTPSSDALQDCRGLRAGRLDVRMPDASPGMGRWEGAEPASPLSPPPRSDNATGS